MPYACASDKPLHLVGLAFHICEVERWKEMIAKLPSGTTASDSFV